MTTLCKKLVELPFKLGAFGLEFCHWPSSNLPQCMVSKESLLTEEFVLCLHMCEQQGASSPQKSVSSLCVWCVLSVSLSEPANNKA